MISTISDVYYTDWKLHFSARYSKTCVNRPPSKRTKNGFQDGLSLNAGQKYCRMLQSENSAILSTFIKLPVVIKSFVLYIFEWPFYTGFTVCHMTCVHHSSYKQNGNSASKNCCIYLNVAGHSMSLMWLNAIFRPWQ